MSKELTQSKPNPFKGFADRVTEYLKDTRGELRKTSWPTREQATNPLIEDGQKLIPSVTRVFSRSRDLYIYLQAYERDATTMHPLAAVVTLLKGEEVVFESPAYTVSAT